MATSETATGGTSTTDTMNHLVASNWLSVGGLLFSFVGVILLTLIGVFGERPLKRMAELWKTNKEDLREGDPSFDLALERTVSRPPDSPVSSSPITTGDYDALQTKLVRSVIGVICTVAGFFMQVAGILVG